MKTIPKLFTVGPLLFVASVLLLALPGSLEAQYLWQANDDGTLMITGYTGPGGAVTIPDTIQGLPVTIIGGGLESFSRLTSVSIPDSVHTIGPEAFSGAADLTSISIGKGVTNIVQPLSWHPGSFIGCNALTNLSVDLLNPVYCSLDGVLLNKTQDRLLRCPVGKRGIYLVPDGVTSIADFAFSDCPALTGVTIPSAVTSIEAGAFSYCTGLSDVTFPGSVTDICGMTFLGCSGLKNVVLPEGVRSLGGDAFGWCSGLTKVTIPNSVTSIGDEAFAHYTGLTGVTIPNSVTSIGEFTFYGNSLTNVIIPSSITSIGNDAFGNCVGLPSVTIPNSVKTIGNEAFSGCSGLSFAGNAPQSIDGPSGIIADTTETNAIVYYLPRTAGWSRTFGGLPAVLWNPRIQLGNAGALHTNPFGLTIVGTPNIPFVLEAAANLAAGPWTPLETGRLTNGLVSFIDRDWTNYPARCYRIRSPSRLLQDSQTMKTRPYPRTDRCGDDSLYCRPPRRLEEIFQYLS